MYNKVKRFCMDNLKRLRADKLKKKIEKILRLFFIFSLFTVAGFSKLEIFAIFDAKR